MGSDWSLASGANLRTNGLVEFRVWVPTQKRVDLKLWRAGASVPEQIPMIREDSLGGPTQAGGGTWSVTAKATPGDLYQYVIDYPNAGEMSVPDPVSRLLPEGVHGRTQIVNPNEFEWHDQNWRGVPMRDAVFYELHSATFTPGGTLDSAIERLSYLRDLGVTVVEIMPVNAFPGVRNWGYDGVGLYAVQASYGGPEALRRLVDAAHMVGLGVVLDVVYNHLGNEGNYLRGFGPYFTHKHETPWGDAINYDDTGSENVRRFFVENALYWIKEYHLDGLRLDAVQTIKDDSKEHIVAEISRRAHALGEELGRTVLVVAETDENDPRYAIPALQGGYGTDGFWSDDFHHAVHVLLTGEKQGYYVDFSTIPIQDLLARALSEGYAFQGEFSPHFGRGRGNAPGELPLPANVICVQNHDQIGNRALGERLTQLVPHGAHKMMVALLLLAPHTPLIFMGQEYDEKAPFQFFTDFGDPVIQKAVSEGRCKEYPHFDPATVPDPQDPQTFERSRLKWELVGRNTEMIEWYRALLRVRKKNVIPNERTCRTEWVDSHTLVMQVPREEPKILVAASLSGELDWSPGKDFVVRLANGEHGFQVRVYEREQAVSGE